MGVKTIGKKVELVGKAPTNFRTGNYEGYKDVELCDFEGQTITVYHLNNILKITKDEEEVWQIEI